MNSEKINIAIVVNTAWNIYNFRLGLIRALIKNGYGVITIAPKDEFVPDIEKTGCKFIDLKRLGRKDKNPVKDMLLVNELKNIYIKENVSIALHYTIKPVIYGTIATNNLKIKSLNTMTGLGFSFLSKGLVSKIVIGLFKYSFRKADRVLFQNKDDLELFLNKKLVARYKTDIVDGSGINTDSFKSNSYPVMNNGFKLLFIGRLLKDKGFFELIQASEQIHLKYPKVKFIIVGGVDFDNPASISERQLKNLKNKEWLDFRGVVKDTRAVIEESHAVVLPSYREGIPRVLLEAMAMKRPIIATDVPGCRETIIDGENGFFVKVKNPNSLASKIEQVFKMNREDLIKMGLRGKEIVLERFDEKKIIKKYIEEINLLRLSTIA